MPFIDIDRVNGQVQFQPANLTAADDDIVIWRNWDPLEQHWITKKGEAQDFWFDSPLAPFRPGQPPDVSQGLNVNPPDILYECSLHKEQGRISFTAAPPAIS
jgi:hypothetical protein